jgi:caffeoyl-CoA O-methyltransferase
MKKDRLIERYIIYTMFAVLTMSFNLHAQSLRKNPELDKKVKAFLDESQNSWRDLNVPATDGQLLHDLIVKNGYKSAVEIGTSTGHSGVWIAWALSKTGGKLITIEIDENRHRQALENFKKAGVSEFIDARLANAHDLVPQLKGPFDFVFSDADKDWYKNYFIEMAPKLVVGGCYTSHNVYKSRGSGWIAEYVKFLESREDFKTTYDERGGGMAISYKTK